MARKEQLELQAIRVLMAVLARKEKKDQKDQLGYPDNGYATIK